MIDNNEIANLRKEMEKLPTWPELGNLKTELRLALDFLQEKRSLSPEDRKRMTELVKDIEKLNVQSDTKETIGKMRDKIIDILGIIFPEKTYEH
jgi:hypothetical protein